MTVDDNLGPPRIIMAGYNTAYLKTHKVISLYLHSSVKAPENRLLHYRRARVFDEFFPFGKFST
ncbi:MAG: hypothetical protein WBF47_19070, partial [Xanthobacteraceae bacterium]